MFSIEGNTIYLTRGDTLFLTVNLTDSDGEPYEPSDGDIIRFAMKRRLTSKEPILLKNISTDTLTFEIEPEDTKSLPYGQYSYDIEFTEEYGHVTTVILDKFNITEEVY